MRDFVADPGKMALQQPILFEPNEEFIGYSGMSHRTAEIVRFGRKMAPSTADPYLLN